MDLTFTECIKWVN